jgi:hypothetical protein
MPGTTEATPRKFSFAPPAEQNVEAWRALLQLDRGPHARWTLNGEVRFKSPKRSVRRVGANADVWKRLREVRGDSAAIVDARRNQAGAEKVAAVDNFIGWLDSEDFGSDPQRIRREAWR